MDNYVAPGNAVQVTIPYAVNQGSGVLVGTGLFGVAQNTYTSGATGIIVTEGVFTRLAKASGTGEGWAVGDKLYWNNTDKNLVKASGTGNTAAHVAICLETVGTAVTTAGEVKLVN